MKNIFKKLIGHGGIINHNLPTSITPVSVPNTKNVPTPVPSEATHIHEIPTVAASIRTFSVPTISIINYSTVVKDAEVQEAIVSIQTQINRDFAPIWGMNANLIFVNKFKNPPINTWVMHILDNTDQINAIGYHTVSNNNLPLGKIFVKTDLEYGLSWTVTLSHEILEMIGDPYINTTVFVQDSNTTGTLYAYEMCDACESDSLGYKIDNILVSDFVTPAYFQFGRLPGTTKFSFRNSLLAPLTIANGGYMSVFHINPTTTGWTEEIGADGIGQRLKSKINIQSSRVHQRSNPSS